MKFEFSAGGVVYKREKKQLLVLVAQHSQHHGWVFPKGIIGDKKRKETKEESALREVREETGIVAKIIKPINPATYWYQFGGDPSTGPSTLSSGPKGSGREKIKKTVYYFLMEYVSGDIKVHDFEMEKVEWLPVDEVEDRLTYKTDKEAFREARELITNS